MKKPRLPWQRGVRDLARDAPKAKPRYADLRPVNRPRADATLKGNEAIYAAVSRISNTMASIPMHLYKGWDPAIGHPLEKLVSYEPNPSYTPFGFVQTMEAFRNTEGNAYALIIEDALGAVKRLDIIDPTAVTPVRNAQDGTLWYEINLGDGVLKSLPDCQIIALRHMSANGMKGIRPLDVLRGSLDFDRQTKELALNQLDGVNHGVMLSVPTAIDEERKAAIINDFMDAYEASGRKVIVLEGGLKADVFSQSSVDSDLLDVERIMRNRVATVYNLPPHMLGDYTDSSFSTMEQEMQEYLQLTIMPIVAQWEQEYNRKLLTPQDYAQGYRFRFDINELIRADVTATAQKHQMAIRGGWMKPNEARARDGLPPDENGDQLMASRDLIPLSISVQHPEMLLGNGAASGEGSDSN